MQEWEELARVSPWRNRGAVMSRTVHAIEAVGARGMLQTTESLFFRGMGATRTLESVILSRGIGVE